MKKYIYLFIPAGIVCCGLIAYSLNPRAESQTPPRETNEVHIQVEKSLADDSSRTVKKGNFKRNEASVQVESTEDQLAQSSLSSRNFRDKNDLSGALTGVLKQFPYLGENYRFSSKALLTSSDKKRWHEILKDKDLIDQTFSHLLYMDGKDSNDTMGDIERINFIHNALSLANNPQEAHLIDSIVKGITTLPDGYLSYSDSQKKTLIGNKIELIYLLKAYHPDEFKHYILGKSDDPKVEKLVKYALANESFINRIFL
ncbi:hypothetical protein [Pseudobacteriovorax antillogorgiicola]|uniref:Uncharacterized protein n=1 Tax=Pseudobacteriovorax antillogorgiicola TaxID=1513793 RepID=A0A1Y6CKK7_9BACT|nr:hypothetical protein [Pseudobacteriovorax antillogorgiicola]TCS45865.1 hypothetical protein EDD56_12628 [Pseudobacteriovorax antillogorgiicola]SMF71322.1 hypothetical protein SAMN06296036_12670 [Pseudobacteriovorax antillogorgiicola]